MVSQLQKDLELDQLSSIGEAEYDIWKTPEGTLFTDGESLTLVSSVATFMMDLEQYFPKRSLR